jgi:hypothetical protein
VSISISIAPSMLIGKCVSDCASGVETAPKLEMDVGDASSKCLRLMPMVSNLDLSFESTRSCDTLAVFAGGSKEGGAVSCVEVIMSEGWLDTRARRFAVSTYLALSRCDVSIQCGSDLQKFLPIPILASTVGSVALLMRPTVPGCGPVND